jgi:large subunit ribosomal protein L9
MAALPLQFEVRVGEQGRLYGSVTAQDIAARLKDAGIEIDRRLIELREPLRTLGEFDVPVRVAHAVTAHLKVTLHDQNAPVAPAPAADEAAAAETEAAEPVEGEANDTEASTLTTPAE